MRCIHQYCEKNVHWSLVDAYVSVVM